MTVGLDTGVEVTTSGIVLDGEEQVLLCASLFYFRLPREVWASRLAQVRASGYRAIDVYLPWNFHETAPGEWDFSGRRDVAAFLDLADQAGLAVLARPGPYICSEWDGGALPAWLSLTEGLRLRQAEPLYLEAVRRWFDHALPLLAERQHGRGGSVIAVQLENELDFFDTEDRTAYLAALRDMALGHGITVPLLACAGQGDLAGATGDVPGVVPACNFYPSDQSPFVEAEVRWYTELLAARGLPLIVTETNRAHVTLRRLLVSGARVIAPYLQASGYNFGYYPSIGNWGDPGGFMSHDYDFGGYLSPLGEPRPEMAQARTLGAVARTLGPRLAGSRPEAADGSYRTTAPTSDSPSLLVLAGGGSVMGMTNLGPEWSEATLAATGTVPEVTVALAPHSCTFVTRDLSLDGFDLPGTLLLATADVVGADANGLELAAIGPSVIVLGGPGAPGSVVTELAAPSPGAPVLATVRAGAVSWDVVVRHPEDVRGPDGAPEPSLPAPAAQVRRIDRAVRLELETRTGRASRHELPPASEAVGVHRGRTHYAAGVGGVAELLIERAGDIVDLVLDGRALPTLASFGATVLVPTGGATHLVATAETWGHANFDDVRLPGLRIGALRGLGRVWSVTARQDVTAGWTVDGGTQWAGAPAPRRPLGGWSSTRLGRPITYRRVLQSVGDHRALHLAGLGRAVHVAVDGTEHLVTPDNPWLHLDPGSGREVAVTGPHAPGVLGSAELLHLEPVRGWDVLAQDDVELLALAQRSAPSTPTALPLRLDAGDEVWVEVSMPPGGCSIRFEGRQVRVSAFAHAELLGRVWLQDDARPRFTGGDPSRIWLPAAWNGGTMRLHVHATSGGGAPALDTVLVTPSQE